MCDIHFAEVLLDEHILADLVASLCSSSARVRLSESLKRKGSPVDEDIVDVKLEDEVDKGLLCPGARVRPS